MSEGQDNIKLLEELKRKMFKTRLLAVDDDPLFLELTETVLKQGTEIELTKVESGEQAIKLLGEGYRPDKIILDLRLQGVDGLEVFRFVQEKCPEVEVIFLTGLPEDERLTKLPSIGIAKVIRKPNNLAEFFGIKSVLLNG